MSLTEAFDDYTARAKDKACCDYGLHVILNEINDQVEDEMEELTKKGVNSFKMFMAYKVRAALVDSIYRSLQLCHYNIDMDPCALRPGITPESVDLLWATRKIKAMLH